MAELNNTDFKATADADLPNNTSGAISAEDVRELLKSVADSFLSRQALAWGEWKGTGQTITTGSTLLAPTLRLEEHPSDFDDPLWDVANNLIDPQFLNARFELTVEFTASALANNTSLGFAIRNAADQTVLVSSSEQLPKTASEDYSISIPFTLTDADQQFIDDKLDIFLVSDGMVTITAVTVDISILRKFSSL